MHVLLNNKALSLLFMRAMWLYDPTLYKHYEIPVAVPARIYMTNTVSVQFSSGEALKAWVNSRALCAHCNNNINTNICK